MVETLCVPTLPAAALAASTTDFREWLENARTGVSACTVDGSHRVSSTLTEEGRLAVAQKSPHHAATFYPASYVSDAFNVVHLSNAVFLPPFLVMIQGEDIRYCAAETIRPAMHGTGIRFANRSIYLTVSDDSLTTRASFDRSRMGVIGDDRTLVIYLSPWNNYGHWHVHNFTFIEWLCTWLPSIVASRGTERVLILAPGLANNMLREIKQFSLQRLRSASAVEVIADGQLTAPFRIRNLLLCSSGGINRGTRWPPIYQRFLGGLRLPQDADAPRRIYCNRSHAGRRGISNEAALEAALSGQGFTIVRPGELSFDAQRRVFSSASLIVGAHGAALTNMIYSYNRPAVIELTHDRYGRIQYEWFQFLSGIMGSAYAPVLHSLTEEERFRSYYDIFFAADVEEVLALVRTVLKAV